MRGLLLLFLFVSVSAQTVLFNEDFNSVSPGNLLINWQLYDGGLLVDNYAPLDMDSTWTVITDYQNSNIGGGNFLYILDSNLTAGFSNINYSDTVETPLINTYGATNLSLSFKTYLYLSSTSSDSAAVDFYDGTKWITLESWNSLASYVSVGGWGNSAATKNYNISAVSSNIKFRFRFYSNGTWSWWAIDDVQVNKTPINNIDAYLINFINSIPDTICLGDSLNISVLASTNSATQHSATVSVSDGNNSITSSSVTLDYTQTSSVIVGNFVFNTPGNITLTAVISANNDINNSNDTLTKNIYVVPKPNINITINPSSNITTKDSACILVSGNYDTILWNVSPTNALVNSIGDSVRCIHLDSISSSPEAVIINIQIGKNNCSYAYDTLILVDYPTILRNNVYSPKIIINNNKVIVLSKKIASIKLYSISGQMLMETKNNYLDLSSLHSGTYLIKILNKSGKVHTKKILLIK